MIEKVKDVRTDDRAIERNGVLNETSQREKFLKSMKEKTRLQAKMEYG